MLAGHRSSSSHRDTSYSGYTIPEHQDESDDEQLPGRRMSTVDKIVRFSGCDVCYYNKEDPVYSPMADRSGEEEPAATAQRQRSIDVRIDMSGTGIEQTYQGNDADAQQ